jgi:hypothetical protein
MSLIPDMELQDLMFSMLGFRIVLEKSFPAVPLFFPF